MAGWREIRRARMTRTRRWMRMQMQMQIQPVKNRKEGEEEG
jgi:hypothetical protein